MMNGYYKLRGLPKVAQLISSKPGNSALTFSLEHFFTRTALLRFHILHCFVFIFTVNLSYLTFFAANRESALFPWCPTYSFSLQIFTTRPLYVSSTGWPTRQEPINRDWACVSILKGSASWRLVNSQNETWRKAGVAKQLQVADLSAGRRERPGGRRAGGGQGQPVTPGNTRKRSARSTLTQADLNRPLT